MKIKEVFKGKDAKEVIRRTNEFNKSVAKREVNLKYLNNIQDMVNNIQKTQNAKELEPDMKKIIDSINDKSGNLSNLSQEYKQNFEDAHTRWKDSLQRLKLGVAFNLNESNQEDIEDAKNAAGTIMDIAVKCEDFNQISKYINQIQEDWGKEIKSKIESKDISVKGVISTLNSEMDNDLSLKYFDAKKSIGDRENFEILKQAVAKLRSTALEHNIQLDDFETWSNKES